MQPAADCTPTLAAVGSAAKNARLQYADNYDKMTDARAQEMLNRRFEQLKLRNQLDEKYRPKFATALSPRRLVRSYQIQQELEVMIELKAVSTIPRMKWWQGE